MRTARTKFSRLVGAIAVGVLALTGCGSSKDTGNTASSANDKITLKVGLFGTFGFKEAGLYDQYMAKHPNIKIEEQSVEQEQTYYQGLQTHLGAGSGLADIQGIEVGRIADVVANQAGKWTDLNTLGAAELKSTFYEWKWDAATTKDGQLVGLGTDIGPEAICYRSDLFKQAGLPTDRAELASRWSTWQGFIDLGRQYHARAPKGSAFTDSAAGMFNAIIGQSQEQFYDAGGGLVYETNPAVRTAWDLSMQAAGAGTSGKWNVAALPGGGAGNWGGSYLGVPKASRHAKEAYELAKWLTAPEQQVTMWLKGQHFPSSSTAAADPKVATATDPYFSGAPLGTLFSAAAQKMPIAFNGPQAGVIKDQFSNGIVAVEQQGRSPDAAWQATLKSIKDALGN